MSLTGVLDALLERVDAIIIGGAMANTFLEAQGKSVGTSTVETEKLPVARLFLKKAVEKLKKVYLPTDVACGTGLDDDKPIFVLVDHISDHQMALDIGPGSIELFRRVLTEARTVFWNGPMGVFEVAPFAAGTKGVAEAVAAVKGLSVVGGGDSAAAVRALGLDVNAFGHISTGGGASLEFLEGKVLPGVAALTDK